MSEKVLPRLLNKLLEYLLQVLASMVGVEGLMVCTSVWAPQSLSPSLSLSLYVCTCSSRRMAYSVLERTSLHKADITTSAHNRFTRAIHLCVYACVHSVVYIQPPLLPFLLSLLHSPYTRVPYLPDDVSIPPTHKHCPVSYSPPLQSTCAAIIRMFSYELALLSYWMLLSCSCE